MAIHDRVVVRQSILGVPLQIASCIIAFFFLVGNAYDLLMVFDNLRFFNRNVVELHKEHPYIDVITLRSMLWKSSIVSLAFDTVRGVFNGLLLYGIVYKSPKYMIPSLFLQCLVCLGYLVLASMLPFVIDRSEFMVELIMVFLFVVNLFSIIILYSYYRELTTDSTPAILGPVDSDVSITHSIPSVDTNPVDANPEDSSPELNAENSTDNN